jgi:hypothetical protein
MFIGVKDPEGRLRWVNLKQFLAIKLGRPPKGWNWSFHYRNDKLVSQTLETKEEAERWLKEKLLTATALGASDTLNTEVLRRN